MKKIRGTANFKNTIYAKKFFVFMSFSWVEVEFNKLKSIYTFATKNKTKYYYFE